MEVSLGEINGKPITISVTDGVLSLNGAAQPVKNITENDLREYQDKIDALSADDPEGLAALKNALTAEFLVKLIGNAVGDECVNRLTRLLDYVHYDVLTYLGETGE
ncbi:MAG: hypothetical protein K2H64_08965 [Desulfovibrio sp.]|nr:hypothetical protein [Desulfovibrio sp.]